MMVHPQVQISVHASAEMLEDTIFVGPAQTTTTSRGGPDLRQRCRRIWDLDEGID